MKITATQRMLEADQNLADDKIVIDSTTAAVLHKAFADLSAANRKIDLLNAKLKIAEYTAQRFKTGRTR